MKLNSYAALEIGTHYTKLVVAEFNRREKCLMRLLTNP